VKAAIYARVSTLEQNPESQLLDLKQLAQQRGMEIFEVYIDHISGARARRPALDKLMADAARHRFDTLLLWSFDRLARSVRHLLETLDEEPVRYYVSFDEGEHRLKRAVGQGDHCHPRCHRRT
jgi:DNA invertase Pin-like site-specific DNA recombinase